MRTHVRAVSLLAAAAFAVVGAAVLSPSPALAQAGTDHLGVTEWLDHGQSLVAGTITLTMQDDGNLVEYADQHIAVWATGTTVRVCCIRRAAASNA